MADRLSIGSVLKAARQSRKVQQTKVAERAQLSSAALSHVEAGRNHPTVGTLKAYAEFVVDPEDIDEFLTILRGSDLLPLNRLAAMISPTDQERFLLLYDEARRRGRARSEMSTDRTLDGPTGSGPTADDRTSPNESSLDHGSHTWQSSLSRTQRASGAEIEAMSRRLQVYLSERGGRPLVPGGRTSDLGLGVQIACDLIEMTRSLVFEFKSSIQLGDNETVELLGRASLLKMHDFRLVICLLSRPSSAVELNLADMLRRAGASVIWVVPDGEHDEVGAPFGGDAII